LQGPKAQSLSLFSIIWPQPDHSSFTSSSDYPKVICYQTYRSQPIEHVREPLTRIIHCNAWWSSQIRT